MSYMDRTFCPPEFADKPECAACQYRFDEQKYKRWCASRKTNIDVSFITCRRCEAENADILPKYYANTNSSKIVFHSDNTNNDITCGKIEGANTTQRKAVK